MGQEQKPVKLKKHSPGGAVLRSAILPGLGQAYNKKYWKIPIIYVGVVALGYSIDYNIRNYNTFRDAYIARTDNDPNTVDKEYEIFSEEQLLKIIDYYRRNLDFSIVGATLLYIANIIDANVDAHLFNFNLSDDLSLNAQPCLFPRNIMSQNAAGIKLTLKL